MEREIDQERKKGREKAEWQREGRHEEWKVGRLADRKEDFNIPEENIILKSWHNNQNT